MAATWLHRAVLGLAAAAGWMGSVCAAAPAPVVTAQDAAARMTIAVRVNGTGPYPFVVDTGSDRTVISRALADALHLAPGHRVRLHDAHGAADVNTVVLDRLSFGGRDVEGVEAPVLDAGNMGAAGMLGIDCLRDQQVVMDFIHHRFIATRSRPELNDLPPGTVVVLGRRRFGQLVLVDAEANEEPIFVILDTGAQNTLGNAALQRLVTTPRTAKPEVVDVISVLGSHRPADANTISEIRLGGIILRHVPIAYSDLETFRQFGLEDRPAMLLGMDILHLFPKVTVDFLRREAAFSPP